MEGHTRQYLLASTITGGVSVFGMVTPAAAAVCPPVMGSFGSPIDCAQIINLPASGPPVLTSTGQPAYDQEGVGVPGDVTIGVTNNTGTTIFSIHLIGSSAFGTKSFDLDGDGVQTVIGLPQGGATTYEGTDSMTAMFDLGGPLNFFSDIGTVGNVGNLNFPGGLVPGGSAFFSLELPLNDVSFLPAPASIAISDLTDGNPTVTLSSDLHFLANPAPVFSPEGVSFSILPDSNVPFLFLGSTFPVTRSVILTEPSTDVNGPFSDFVTLTAFQPLTIGQRIEILFESDTAPTFAADVAALGDIVGQVVENGSAQDVSGPNLLNTFSALIVTIQSDFPGTPEPVPEPATWLLLATGLLGWIGCGRLKKHASYRVRPRIQPYSAA